MGYVTVRFDDDNEQEVLPSELRRVKASESIEERKAKLGSGGRFRALSGKLSKRGVKDPRALAAWIGRKKYGPSRYAKLSRHESADELSETSVWAYWKSSAYEQEWGEALTRIATRFDGSEEGSGSGFGERDVSWGFPNKEKAQAFVAAVKKVAKSNGSPRLDVMESVDEADDVIPAYVKKLRVPIGASFIVGKPYHSESTTVFPVVMSEEGAAEEDWELVASARTKAEAQRIVNYLLAKNGVGVSEDGPHDPIVSACLDSLLSADKPLSYATLREVAGTEVRDSDLMRTLSHLIGIGAVRFERAAGYSLAVQEGGTPTLGKLAKAALTAGQKAVVTLPGGIPVFFADMLSAGQFWKSLHPQMRIAKMTLASYIRAIGLSDDEPEPATEVAGEPVKV